MRSTVPILVSKKRVAAEATEVRGVVPPGAAAAPAVALVVRFVAVGEDAGGLEGQVPVSVALRMICGRDAAQNDGLGGATRAIVLRCRRERR